MELGQLPHDPGWKAFNAASWSSREGAGPKAPRMGGSGGRGAHRPGPVRDWGQSRLRQTGGTGAAALGTAGSSGPDHERPRHVDAGMEEAMKKGHEIEDLILAEQLAGAKNWFKKKRQNGAKAL